MNPSPDAPDFLPERGPFQGTLQILRYNGPFYVFAGVATAVGILVLRFVYLPSPLPFLGWAGIALGLWWVVASVAASWYIYDFSPLMKWQWVPGLLPRKPISWVNLHAGLDESTLALHHLLGGAGEVWDFYDKETMTEPSIEKARCETPEDKRAPSVRTDALPAPDDSRDAAFLFFAAHEIRSPRERDVFWHEIARIVEPGGCVVVAEHLRDAANFAVFGPGFMHFLPRAEWLRLFDVAHLEVRREWAISPFTRVFVLRKSDDPDDPDAARHGGLL